MKDIQNIFGRKHHMRKLSGVCMQQPLGNSFSFRTNQIHIDTLIYALVEFWYDHDGKAWVRPGSRNETPTSLQRPHSSSPLGITNPPRVSESPVHLPLFSANYVQQAPKSARPNTKSKMVALPELNPHDDCPRHS